MSLVATPTLAVVESEAPLTEWAPKTNVSTPAASSKDFGHLAMELDETAFCCRMMAMKSLFSSPLRTSVLFSYSTALQQVYKRVRVTRESLARD